MRLPILECGSRLVAKGLITDVNDVFQLNREEVKAGLKGTDQKGLVASRKAGLAEWAKIVPRPP